MVVDQLRTAIGDANGLNRLRISTESFQATRRLQRLAASEGGRSNSRANKSATPVSADPKQQKRGLIALFSAEVRRLRSDRCPSPWSTPPRNLSQTSPG